MAMMEVEVAAVPLTLSLCPKTVYHPRRRRCHPPLSPPTLVWSIMKIPCIPCTGRPVGPSARKSPQLPDPRRRRKAREHVQTICRMQFRPALPHQPKARQGRKGMPARMCVCIYVRMPVGDRKEDQGGVCLSRALSSGHGIAGIEEGGDRCFLNIHPPFLCVSLPFFYTLVYACTPVCQEL